MSALNPPGPPVDPNPPTPPVVVEPEEEWKNWYLPQVQQVTQDIHSGTDNFDQSMLTLSSAALGVSLAFIKDIVPLAQAVWKLMLLTSWVAFALCIVTTVLSFRFSIAALKRHRDLLDEIYTTKNREKAAAYKPSFWNKVVSVSSYVAAVLFLAGLTCTVLFVVKNVSSFPPVSRVGSEATTPHEVTNFYMSDDGKATKVVVPKFTRGRSPMKLMPAPKAAPAKPSK